MQYYALLLFRRSSGKTEFFSGTFYPAVFLIAIHHDEILKNRFACLNENPNYSYMAGLKTPAKL